MGCLNEQTYQRLVCLWWFIIHLHPCFFTVKSNTLNKNIKTIHNFIKNPIIEVTTLLSSTETWERKCGSWERLNEQPAGESGVQGQRWRQSVLEDSSSGWQLTVEPSQLSIWHDSACKSASQIYDDCTKTSHPFWQTRHKTAVGALFPLSDTQHTAEVQEKSRERLPVFGLDECVNPGSICWGQDVFVLSHTHPKGHSSPLLAS